MMWKRNQDTTAKPQELRKAFMETLSQLMEEDPRMIMLEADLGGASGSTLLAERHPDQFINVGIAEANMLGVAAGLSMRGLVPFVHTFSPFISRRAADQLYLEGAYAGNTINIYASDPGICAAANGGTHTTFEDIAFLRAVPGVQIFQPADAVQLRWLVRQVAGQRGVHYIRANRKDTPVIYGEGSCFTVGKGNLLRQGRDVAIFSMGDLLQDALNAAEVLEGMGISAAVADLFTVKPLDRELVQEMSQGKRLVLTLENHSIYGGLGGAVAEVLADAGGAPPLMRLGIADQFGQVGSMDYLKEVYGLTAGHVVRTVVENLA